MRDIKTFVTSLGEIIGTLEEEFADAYKIGNPRLFAQTAQGVGFMPGICMSGKKEPKEVTLSKTHVVTVVETDEALVKAWREQTSGLVLP